MKYKDQMINEERRKIQIECESALCKNNYNGFAILPTGTGKGWVLVEILKKLNPKKAIYLCDSVDNRDKTFKDELRKWGAEEWINKIEFQCYRTAYKYKGQSYDLALCDEADYSLTPEYSQFYFNNTIDHIVLVSATLLENKRLLASKIAPIVYEKNIQEIQDQGVLNDAKYTFVNFMLSPEENRKYLTFNDQMSKLYKERDGEESQKRKNSITERIEFITHQRSHFLRGLESSKKVCKQLLKRIYLATDKNKILVFCGLNKQADEICKYSYHSENQEQGWLEKFDKGIIRVCAVVGKVDRGRNLEGVNNIIFEAPFKSKSKFVQKSGRGRRLHIDDILYVYFQIPYYKTRRGELKPTVVEKWVLNSTSDIDLQNAKTIFI